MPLVDTQHGGYGNSKRRTPNFHRPLEAYMVSRWLIEKRTARLGSTAHIRVFSSVDNGHIHAELLTI